MDSFYKSSSLSWHLAWALPVLLFLAFLPFSKEADLALSSLFYKEGAFSKDPFYQTIYIWGLLPGQMVISGASIYCLLSLISPLFKKHRQAALSLVLSLAIGSGLFAHLLCKDYWGRPRPVQTAHFGGPYPFKACYEPEFQRASEPKRSFPCGHCTMGYYFFSVALLAKRAKRQKLFLASLFFAFFLGGLLSLARVAQGGHYLSDILASMLIMWLSALFIDAFVFRNSQEFS
ncbi:MAG: putative rane-associated phospholipid phosphatase [Chlamydiales bacterium]|nr:putative rane-associated phospholipid phosphatase [Chlamydiales bacterium]